ncbi:hypothetical protein ACQ4PT_010629 [Festuca glaucescens]
MLSHFLSSPSRSPTTPLPQYSSYLPPASAAFSSPSMAALGGIFAELKTSDYTSMFLEALSALSEEKKFVIRKLGFGSILQFSCCNNIQEIFMWLVSLFDIYTSTVTLEDGFSFTLSSHFMQMILGFPSGSKHVCTTASKEASEFIEIILNKESPTVQHLCSLLTQELDEDVFKVIFMLLMVTVFIDPNGSGIANPSYYPNFKDISSIQHLDWCSFTLDCLLKSIKKYLFRKSQDIKSEIGGCKIVLVVLIYFLSSR